MAKRFEALHPVHTQEIAEDFQDEADRLRADEDVKAGLERVLAVADETRFLILMLLYEHENNEGTLSAPDIQVAFRLSEKTVSRHLSVLVKAKLVKLTKEGRWIRYGLEEIAKPYLVDLGGDRRYDWNYRR